MLQKVFYLSLYVRNTGRRRKQNVETGPVKEKSAIIVGQRTETR